MKILTWNLQRPFKKNEAIENIFAEFDADILILTETNSIINPGEDYTQISSQTLPAEFDGVKYKIGENRTTIWTKFKIKKQIRTSDNFTSVCCEIEIDKVLLNIYGTITGVFGGKGERFKSDLKYQISDFEKLNGNICIAGDLNTFFSGYAYPSLVARQSFNEIFEKLNLVNLTSEISENVDHIVISKKLIENKTVNIETWNHDKKLSDHIGVCVTILE